VRCQETGGRRVRISNGGPLKSRRGWKWTCLRSQLTQRLGRLHLESMADWTTGWFVSYYRGIGIGAFGKKAP